MNNNDDYYCIDCNRKIDFHYMKCKKCRKMICKKCAINGLCKDCYIESA